MKHRVLVLAAVVAALLAGPPGVAHARPQAPAGFVNLADVDPTILHDIRYKGFHNFVGRPINGYVEPLCLLTQPAAAALKRVQAQFIRRGYTLKVYDCYRPQRAVDHFAAWAEDLDDELTKREFYPEVEKATLFDDGYIAHRSGHSRGSTVDLTVVRLPARPQPPYVLGQPLARCFAPVWQRFPDNTVDMGTGYDCFDPRANTLDPRITGRALANRLMLRDAMAAAGFNDYDLEWWHFTLAGEPYPDTFFDFPVARRSLL
ncbi:D-alanyl-D-alanine dipeptidase [Catenuloplanes nepalensis]|uniref:D-alanyl-D-alanine dipeptidase n=1 Tax=Catenuloplanes nepalensis TaxID=587533 RepID=A0ABT9MPW5_9ACTN|nr:M15 family metallopeptidase [Catenuloplanes nepalensis]MDP9793469.1 D-alanyl-D-alanine dipeptidase [Catenuloplanes nepalensis]